MQMGAIFLPGIVTPAEIAFGGLQIALGTNRLVVMRDLAIYEGETVPPENYCLGMEIDAVLQAAADNGFDRFHLVGYSAGAGIAAAIVAKHGDRIASLALLEPSWLGNEGVSETLRNAFALAVAAADLPGPEAMAKFAKLNVADDVELPFPPQGDPPPWMAQRPAAIRAIGPAFLDHHLDQERLSAFNRSVLYVLGSLSNPDLYVETAKRAESIFPDFTLEVFKGRHHFDPPHRAEPQRMATLLQDFWSQSE